ncbi:hypothetical protein VIGAN_05104800 [Vigna angularis var. angularis]|uniref:Uncharacterized protein n=1 Tax=Vigna angularis var. angularis TaxID=157739 RepID=A0A0S3S4A1_PHAAN|nr:hypothetical protein VIGAN_05104800 [Vigna angularis var. angularis]
MVFECHRETSLVTVSLHNPIYLSISEVNFVKARRKAVAVHHYFLVLIGEAEVEELLLGSKRNVVGGVVVGVVLLGLDTDESPLEAVHHLLTLL